jgi:ribosomal protein RSM22 (predicted rRNA methylase)
MRLPQYLASAIGEVTAGPRSASVAAASREVTQRYKSANFAVPAIRSSAERAAYLAARFPATFAANLHVFSELRRRAPEVEVATLLDLGAGPGTSLFAAAEIFSELSEATLVEVDPEWAKTGRRLAEQSPHSSVRNAQWVQLDLRDPADFRAHDVVVISYALGELAPAMLEQVVRRAWASAEKFLVLVEPGTRRGFAGVNGARSWLIEHGARILAPCPHQAACPMAAAGDWCHFSQRLERTGEHRRLKGAELGYEDEKFSYLIATRLELQAAQARIVRHPRKHSGYAQLELCTSRGTIEKTTVTKSNKEAYRRARQAEWGDEWQETG